MSGGVSGHFGSSGAGNRSLRITTTGAGVGNTATVRALHDMGSEYSGGSVCPQFAHTLCRALPRSTALYRYHQYFVDHV